MTRNALGILAAGVLAGGAFAQSDTRILPSDREATRDGPRSAIDWLTDPDTRARPVVEPAVSITETPGVIQTTPLGAPTRGGVGLLSPEISGLPLDTFRNARPERLSALISDLRLSDLPALQDLALVLLLAELPPPAMADGGESLLRLRVERLVAFGALEQAQALLEQAGAETPSLFPLWFNVSLLTGNDDAACAALLRSQDLLPDLAARVFCLSRSNDWAAAALSLETGLAIGAISPEDWLLLAHFLDPEAFEGEPLPPIPPEMTPLRFRLLDGVGEPPDTRTLPLAYAISDLRETIGWKAQLEAAERLTRAQAVAPETLRALYTARQPAASGGVWDRAAAIQTFEDALLSGDPGAIANTLPEAWAVVSRAGLQVPFAQLYGAEVAKLPLAPAVSQLAFKIGLLSKDYAEVAETAPPSQLPRDAFAVAIARGTTADPNGLGAVATAVAAGFEARVTPMPFASLVAEDRLGEALLQALGLLQDGQQSDPGDITAVIALLRLHGLEDVAQRVALQLMLMERPV